MDSASSDNIRLWNVAEANEPDASGKMKSGVQFKIIPGHHGGFISQMGTSVQFSSTASLTDALPQSLIEPLGSLSVQVVTVDGLESRPALYSCTK